MSRVLSLLFVGIALSACRSHHHDTATTASSQQANRNDEGVASGSDSRTTVATNPNRPGHITAKSMQAWSDDEFVRNAIQGGVFEVESSRVALEKASSGAVRAFATTMIDDHGKANTDLNAIARRNRGDVPETLDEEHQKKLEDLKKLEGPAFDREYLRCQIAAHDAAIALFERASRESQDRELKDFATRTLPVLRNHRTRLDDIQGSPTKEARNTTGN